MIRFLVGGRSGRLGLATLLSVVMLGVAGCGGDGEGAGTTQPDVVATVGDTATDAKATAPTTSQETVSEWTPVSAAKLAAAESEFDEVVTALMVADAAHDREVTRPHYASDVVVIDGDASKPVVGIDELLDIYANTWALAPQEVTTHTATFMGLDDGVAVLPQHGLLEFTEEDPMLEYRIVGVRDGVVAYWTAFYDPTTRPFFTENPAIEQAAITLRGDYVEAWSSRDPAAVAALFTADAVYTDPLADQPLTGARAIESHAADIFAAHPAISWDLSSAIGSRDTGVVRSGGVLAIRVSDGPECVVDAIVILEGSPDGIVAADIYYEVSSLIACGLAR